MTIVLIIQLCAAGGISTVGGGLVNDQAVLGSVTKLKTKDTPPSLRKKKEKKKIFPFSDGYHTRTYLTNFK